MDLEKKLRQYDEAYYHGTKPLISDQEYDQLVDQYELIYGTYIIKSNNVDILPICAPSMNKIRTQTKLEQWDLKHPGEKILSDKIDGMSIIIDYRDGIKIYTHSDATHGQNISHLLPYLNIPRAKNIVVRGELTIKLSTYEKYKHEFTSPRNMISGVVNRKIPSEILKDFTFLAFQLEEELTIEEQFNKLKNDGFDVVSGIQKVNTLDFNYLQQLLKEPCEYPRDGITIVLNTYEKYTSSLPENKIAFKVIGETTETTVKYVEWNQSRKSVLKPRIHIEKIYLDNAYIEWTNGFNAKFIKDNNVGPGTKLLMTRSGGINPYILEVIEGTTATLPEGIWDKTGTNLLCPLSDEVMIKRIYYFFEILETKHLGLKMVEKIYHGGYNTVAQFIHLRIDDLLKIKGFQVKGATRIYQGIQQAIKNITLAKLMIGSSLFPGLGEIKIESILNKIPECYDLLQYKIPEIQNIKDVDGIKQLGDVFLENLPDFVDFLKELNIDLSVLTKSNIDFSKSDMDLSNIENQNIITPPLILADYKGLPLKGMTIVFSGDKKLTNQAKMLGAAVDKNVTKRTTLLVVDQVGIMNNKEKTCMEKGIKIMSLEEFKKLI